MFVDALEIREVDIDEKIPIGEIEQIAYDETGQDFFILANRYHGTLGFYLIRFNEATPEEFTFEIQMENKLDIHDCNIEILNNIGQGIREAVISYKTIYMNTYTITCIDLAQKNDTSVIFMHESFQLWESRVTSVLMRSSKNFLQINKNGLTLTAIGFGDKRHLQDDQGKDLMIFPLESFNYLKVDKGNYMFYACQDPTK